MPPKAIQASATLPASKAEALKPEAAEVAKRFDPEASRYLKDRYKQLSKHLKARTKEEGETVELLNLIGILNVQHAKSSEAREHFDRALQEAPGDPTSVASSSTKGRCGFRSRRRSSDRRFTKP